MKLNAPTLRNHENLVEIILGKERQSTDHLVSCITCTGTCPCVQGILYIVQEELKHLEVQTQQVQLGFIHDVRQSQQSHSFYL